MATQKSLSHTHKQSRKVGGISADCVEASKNATPTAHHEIKEPHAEREQRIRFSALHTAAHIKRGFP